MLIDSHPPPSRNFVYHFKWRPVGKWVLDFPLWPTLLEPCSEINWINPLIFSRIFYYCAVWVVPWWGTFLANKQEHGISAAGPLGKCPAHITLDCDVRNKFLSCLDSRLLLQHGMLLTPANIRGGNVHIQKTAFPIWYIEKGVKEVWKEHWST